MAEWKKGTYSKNTGTYSDIWGQISTQHNKGWFVPSSNEFIEFIYAFDASSKNIRGKYGLSETYWTSSLFRSNSANYTILNTMGLAMDLTEYCFVRLSITF